MMIAKVFESGRCQAVRLPKEYRIPSEEVMVNKIGEIVFLMQKTSRWDSLMRAVDMLSDDYMEDGREVQRMQSVNDCDVHA